MNNGLRSQTPWLSLIIVTMFTLAMLTLAPAPADAVFPGSGSTGVDGPLNPPALSGNVVEITSCLDAQRSTPCFADENTRILNLTSINIPAGVTVKFKRNAANSPVILLVQGSVTIAGVIDVSGKPGAAVGVAGDGTSADDGLGGAGGPGGFDGGRGGATGNGSLGSVGTAGLGPGGGGVSRTDGCAQVGGGSGAGFSGSGGFPQDCRGNGFGSPGPSYGTIFLVPLIGGSGGGGGAGGVTFSGSGGGGGGGAILIAAPSITITGIVKAKGGDSGASIGIQGCGASGGGGSGGAIRIVAGALTISGAPLDAAGGAGTGGINNFCRAGGSGSDGRIRLEYDSIQGIFTTNPIATVGIPAADAVSVAVSDTRPRLVFTSLTVDGTVPPRPADCPAGLPGPVALPSSASQADVTVGFTTCNVRTGPQVVLIVTQQSGDRRDPVRDANRCEPGTSYSGSGTCKRISAALAGTIAVASASVTVELPATPGVYILQAQTTFTITASMGDSLSRFAQGERVEKVTLVATPGAPNDAILHTASGKTFRIAAALLPPGS